MAAATICAAIAVAGCGKRGPPLAPFVRLPAAISQIAATRLGSEVYVTLTVPAMNVDLSEPADVVRIEVYGYTGRAAPLPARFTEFAPRIATIPVVPLAMPGDPPLPPPPPFLSGAQQGLAVTIRDTLTADELVEAAVPAVDPRQRRPTLIGGAGGSTDGPLRRFYMAVGFSERSVPGPPGALADLILTSLPDPPVAVRVSQIAASVSLTWEPAGGPLGFLLDTPLPPEPAPFFQPIVAGSPVPPPIDIGVPPGPTRYNVYLELAPDPLVLPALPLFAPPITQVPMALNSASLSAISATDAIEFGRERCYTVRAIRGTGTTTVVSEPSARTCITPQDVFPPAAPTELVTVPSDEGISLIWAPNSEPDLGGYLVLRREVGGATLRQLTDTAIPDARFRDTAVTPGTRYAYAVAAVDTHLPLPNVSPGSAWVEETAR